MGWGKRWHTRAHKHAAADERWWWRGLERRGWVGGMVGGWRWWEVLLATRATLTYVCVRQGLRLRKWWWHRGLRGQATTPCPQTCLHYYFKSRADGEREKIIPRRFVHSTVRPDPLVFFSLSPTFSHPFDFAHPDYLKYTMLLSTPSSVIGRLFKSRCAGTEIPGQFSMSVKEREFFDPLYNAGPLTTTHPFHG